MCFFFSLKKHLGHQNIFDFLFDFLNFKFLIGFLFVEVGLQFFIVLIHLRDIVYVFQFCIILLTFFLGGHFSENV